MQEQAGKVSSLSLFTPEEIANGFQAIRKRFLEYQKFKVRNKTIYRSEEEEEGEEEEDEEIRASKQKQAKNGPIKKSGKPSMSAQIISDDQGQMEMENETRKIVSKQQENNVPAATNFQLKKNNQKAANKQQTAEQINKIAEPPQAENVQPSPSFAEDEQTFTEIPSRKNNSIAISANQRNKQPKIEDQYISNYAIQNKPPKDNKYETKQEATAAAATVPENQKIKEKLKKEGEHSESSQSDFSNFFKNPIEIHSVSKKEETEDAICKKRFLSNQKTIETQKIPLAKKSAH